MHNIDLKLLAYISVLQKTRSVSKAAQRLGVSQSTVSMTLAKLRDHFHDPIFVRTSAGMETTPYGAEIMDHLKRAEDLLQLALEHHTAFLPASADRVFHVHSTDIAQETLFPRLMQRLQAVGPGLRVKLDRISDDTPAKLESGEADLAVGFILPMGGGFCHQGLFKDHFVCVAGRDHPRIRGELTLEQFQNETHLDIATLGNGHSLLAKALEDLNIKRRVGLTVPGFLGIASIICATGFVAMIPEQLAQQLARIANIKIIQLPFGLPSHFVMQHWHERYSNDPANKWLRGILADLFLEHSAFTKAEAAAAR